MLFDNFIQLFLESAPWLLLGFVLAGLLKVFVPMEWMQKQLGGHGFKTVLKAALLGAPLPLCSCGVIPAAVGLRRSGASKAATTSFLVSTPETGVDSVTVSYVLLGPFMAIVRPIAAIISAVVAGLLVGRDEVVNKPSCCSSSSQATQAKDVHAESVASAVSTEPAKSCCSTQASAKADVVETAESCCASTKDMATELKQQSILSRVGSGLHYAATDLVRDTTLWLLVGLFFAALVQTYVPGDFLAKWGDGILAMLVMVLVSVPMYICATASTPIAAGLLLAGVSPGAVLVFMMAGPATNIATLGVVSKELGKRALLGYLGGVIGVALVSGMVVNYLVATFGFEVMPQIGHEHELLPQGVVAISGIVLAILMAKVLWDKLPKKQKDQSCCS
ncbi:SO_0444 family Cu/Zn efflux transporter [Shewanella sp. OMA3-2]|uniref:SO_0444 family Cu/Zn efflux transporter n=1 Tax=Shewanella sp. OMA3-2 TaxID=2908650 RepID=UPI001F1FA150|nr:SO_0444 family Cu/Zn efflux transporter [Shewanella sp. OMA3-2]UJF21893.1 SO_0444 family Cu/Zn efflux transporter [Shewanella sp. OMA3-2]